MSGIGALVGLTIGILLIIFKFNTVYSLLFAAVISGLFEGLGLSQTVTCMVTGIKDMTPAILLILSAGVLAGALVQTGSAEKIAEFIIRGAGKRNTLFALVLAVFFLTFSGVFIDVAVITAAPIALSVGARAGFSRSSILLAMIGGGKAGNVISPNPNTIAVAEKFETDLPSVMFANWLPAIAGIAVTIFLSWLICHRGEILTEAETSPIHQKETLPNLFSALLGPFVTLTLLALRPLVGIRIEPFLALPAGGLVCIAATWQWSKFKESLDYGLSKMSSVAIFLIGTGALAGVLKESFKEMVLSFLQCLNLPQAALAPISGALLSGATASTTAGASAAAASFSEIILAAGITATAGAAMINAGATVLDHLPHGSFFHATGGAVRMSFSERLKLIPLESAVGFTLALVSLLVNR